MVLEEMKLDKVGREWKRKSGDVTVRRTPVCSHSSTSIGVFQML